MATLLAACLLAGGCGGMSAAPSFSPMMLLIPGMGKNERPVPLPTVPPAHAAEEITLAQSS